MSKEVVSPLRQRMLEDMNARKLGKPSQRGHIHSSSGSLYFSSARPRPPHRMTSAASSCT